MNRRIMQSSTYFGLSSPLSGWGCTSSLDNSCSLKPGETLPQCGSKESYCPIFYCPAGVACKQTTVSLCLCPDQLCSPLFFFFHALQSPMWLACPTCHDNKVKDTVATVDNGKANMFRTLGNWMCSAYYPFALTSLWFYLLALKTHWMKYWLAHSCLFECTNVSVNFQYADPLVSVLRYIF